MASEIQESDNFQEPLNTTPLKHTEDVMSAKNHSLLFTQNLLQITKNRQTKVSFIYFYCYVILLSPANCPTNYLTKAVIVIN